MPEGMEITDYDSRRTGNRLSDMGSTPIYSIFNKNISTCLYTLRFYMVPVYLLSYRDFSRYVWDIRNNRTFENKKGSISIHLYSALSPVKSHATVFPITVNVFSKISLFFNGLNTPSFSPKGFISTFRIEPS